MPLSTVQAFIEAHGLPESGESVIVGVSGGVDSVVLLHVLATLGCRPIAVHVNYRLRGEASDADEAFVRALAAGMEVPFHVIAHDTRELEEAQGRSLQDLARSLRFSFFKRVAEASDCRVVALGHHIDDQAETILLNLFRGCGVEGLAGMPPVRSIEEGSDILVVRPLLHVRRSAIEAYARGAGIQWREDASNDVVKYRRNVIRQEILPLIEERFGASTSERLAHTASLVRGYLCDEMRPEIREAFRLFGRSEGAGGHFSLAGLGSVPSGWRRRLILEAVRRWLPGCPYRETIAASIDRLRASQPGRRVSLMSGTVWRTRTSLHFEPVVDAGGSLYDEQSVDAGPWVAWSGGAIRVTPVSDPGSVRHDGATYEEFVDAAALRWPLTLRPWRPGDRFRPIGLGHSKKVSDYLTDEKVPVSRRGAVRVLCSGDDIIWVVGYRLSQTVARTQTTKAVYRLSYKPTGDE